jgi:hypothetical protein
MHTLTHRHDCLVFHMHSCDYITRSSVVPAILSMAQVAREHASSSQSNFAQNALLAFSEEAARHVSAAEGDGFGAADDSIAAAARAVVLENTPDAPFVIEAIRTCVKDGGIFPESTTTDLGEFVHTTVPVISMNDLIKVRIHSLAGSSSTLCV